MTALKIEELDIEEMQALGLMDNENNILISDENKQKLEQGLKTNDIRLSNILIRDKICDFDCKLSLYKDTEGATRIKIHPYYLDIEKSNLLSEEEMKYISEKGGVHVKETGISGELMEHGKAPYQFDEKNKQDSYFIKLKSEGKEKYVWGVMLEPALKNANVIVGTNITIKQTGVEPVKVNVPIIKDGIKVGEKQEIVNRNNFDIAPHDKSKDLKNSSILVEYNKNTKSFDILDANKIPLVVAVNGVELSKEQQESLKEGKEIHVNTHPNRKATKELHGTSKDGKELGLEEDEIRLKVSPKESSLFLSNKKLLILSVLLDGGMSFMMVKAAELIQKKIEAHELNKAILEENRNSILLKADVMAKELKGTLDQNKIAEYKEIIKECDKQGVIKELGAILVNNDVHTKVFQESGLMDELKNTEYLKKTPLNIDNIGSDIHYFVAKDELQSKTVEKSQNYLIEEKELLEKISKSDNALHTITTRFDDEQKLDAFLKKFNIEKEFDIAFHSAYEAEPINFKNKWLPDLEGETYPFTPEQEKAQLDKLSQKALIDDKVLINAVNSRLEQLEGKEISTDKDNQLENNIKKLEDAVIAYEVTKEISVEKLVQQERERTNKLYMEQLTKLEKEIDSLAAKLGNTPELKDVKANVISEYEKAEASLSYKNPQVIVSTDDKVEEEEKVVTEDREEEQAEQEIQEQEQEQEQTRSTGRRR